MMWKVRMSTKLELMNKLRSPDNKVVLQAVEELRVRGWLGDGSLRGVALCQAQLQGCDLMGANMSTIDLHQAQLTWAGANFSKADLTGADLYKANLRGANNLTDEQLKRVKRLWGATMPDGNPYDGRFNLAGDLEIAHWGNINVNDPQAMADFHGVSLETYREGQDLKITV
jgi:uncharacterized protein YjbI with pentapeptide repeats